MTNLPIKCAIALSYILLSSLTSGCFESGADTVTNDVDGGAPSGNSAPVISGTPAAAVVTGQNYSFVPQANDPNGDILTFSVAGLPQWANFNSATGELSGAPAIGQEGTYANIVITVSDGQFSASTPAFSIDVLQAGAGAATLSWTPPTRNSDGSALVNLAGYRIYYGLAANRLTNIVRVDSPGVSSFVVQNLAPNTYYFVAAAVNSDGIESPFSNIVTKVVSAP